MKFAELAALMEYEGRIVIHKEVCGLDFTVTCPLENLDEEIIKGLNVAVMRLFVADEKLHVVLKEGRR